jgi:hypothetical protein
LGRPLHNVHDDEMILRESNPARYEFTVGYDNTGLWCGVAFFSLIGAMFFFVMSGLALIHAGIVPGRLPPGFGPGNYAFGATVCTIFGLTGWYCGVVAIRRSQRFEVWTNGIRWIRRKKLCCQLSWEDITSLVLRDDKGNLVLYGASAQSPLKIPAYYNNVDALIGKLEEETELESLLPASPTTASPVSVGNDKSGVQPLVYRRRRLVLVQFLFLLLMACGSTVVWTSSTQEEKPDATRVERRIRGGIILMRYLGPALCAGAVWSLLSTWIEFRVDRDGVWIRYLLGHKRYSWNSLRSVDVQLKRHRQHVRQGGDLFCVPELHIHLKNGEELVFPQIDDAYRFRDAIQAGPQLFDE